MTNNKVYAPPKSELLGGKQIKVSRWILFAIYIGCIPGLSLGAAFIVESGVVPGLDRFGMNWIFLLIGVLILYLSLAVLFKNKYAALALILLCLSLRLWTFLEGEILAWDDFILFSGLLLSVIGTQLYDRQE